MIFSYIGLCKPSNLPPTITGYLLGNIFGVYLYGALTVQLYRYHISFPKDPKPFKIVIYAVYVAETICTALLIYELSAIIIRTASFNICSYNPLVLMILAVCGGIVAFLTQSMYAYRMQIITKLKYISWVIILVMALQLVAIITMSFVKGLVTIVWSCVSLVVDVTITSIMVWSLNKDEIYSKQLKKKITHLIYLIIGTGSLTAATNLCLLVLIFYSTEEDCYGLLIVLSKLYANSMMVLVNSRIPSARSEINHRATLDMITVQLSSFRATSQTSTDAEAQREISVDPETRGVGLSAHEAEDTTNNCDLGSLTV